MKEKHDYKPVTIGQLLGVIFSLILFACTSCEPKNDTECDRITQQYMQSVQYAETAAAKEELQRQYQQALNKARC